MFTGLWAKITGVLSVAIAVLLAVVGYQRKTIKRQDDIIETHDKKDEIIDDMRLAEQEANEDAESKKDAIDTSNWRNRI